jgi:hypothetical protein
MSYRLDSTSEKDRLIGFKEWVRHGIKKRRNNPYIKIINNKEFNHLLLVSNIENKDKTIHYINDNHSLPVDILIGKDNISLSVLKVSIWEKFLFHLFCLSIGFSCFFSISKRSNKALLIRQTLELGLISKVIKEFHVHHISFFQPYEIDSNVISLFAQSKNIETTYIPSLIPLFVHNRHLLCDNLVLSSPYHEEEIVELFKNSILFKKIVRWPPETLYNLKISFEDALSNKIAFYSHGQWLRNKLSKTDNGLGAENNELDILKWLKLGVEKNLWNVVVYLHPIEKMHLIKSQEHYSAIFKKTKFELITDNKPAAHFFHEENIGIGTLSTVIFERLLVGRKTLLFPGYSKYFPTPKSSINNICFSNFELLCELWGKYQNKSNETFFRDLNLNIYKNYFDSFKKTSNSDSFHSS